MNRDFTADVGGRGAAAMDQIRAGAPSTNFMNTRMPIVRAMLRSKRSPPTVAFGVSPLAPLASPNFAENDGLTKAFF